MAEWSEDGLKVVKKTDLIWEQDAAAAVMRGRVGHWLPRRRLLRQSEQSPLGLLLHRRLPLRSTFVVRCYKPKGLYPVQKGKGSCFRCDSKKNYSAQAESIDIEKSAVLYRKLICRLEMFFQISVPLKHCYKQKGTSEKGEDMEKRN